jgi:hypothetical protein
MSDKLEPVKKYDISGELSRNYEYSFFVNKNATVHIENPVSLYCGMGHAFHRVWDGATVHLLHAPGPIRDIDGNIIGLCKITWVPRDGENPVKF